jgi:ketosteroid isomerase-like protein
VRLLKWHVLLFSLLSCAALVANPATETATRRIVMRHVAAMTAREVDAVMSDYAADAVLINPAGTYVGTTAIRAVIRKIAASSMRLDAPARQIYEGDIGYLVWPSGSGATGTERVETLIARDGKIVTHTVAEVAGRDCPH